MQIRSGEGGFGAFHIAAHEALIRACAEGEGPPDGPQKAPAILSRHAPLAAVMTDFYVKVQDEDRETLYPSEALRRALQADRSRRS
ncbi:hypothetical protein [Streptomyces cyaneofuscatus]|uniref:hypothetical protein n=1 Tax=Streptomyces cyaneofuscatus TaxID=66883 RepID=UPI003654D652